MYKHILVPVDLGDEASWRKALPPAITLARADAANLHVVNVLPDFGMSVVGAYFSDDFEKQARREAEAALTAVVSSEVPEDIAVHKIVARGSVYREIMATAEKVNADLIVMAAHRPELKDYLLGPNAARVVRHADQSVLIVR